MDSHDVRQEWADRTGEYSPTYYSHYGSDATSELVRETVVDHVGRDASVLELGCGVGRHLAELSDHGVTDLTGVDINTEALDVLAETYPDLAATGTFHATTIEDYVTDLADGAFDAVVSVETLQHLHPDVDWVFDDIARVVGESLVTVENETGAHGEVTHVDEDVPLYHRDWNRVFTGRGLVEVDSADLKRDRARVFRPAES